MEISVRQLIMKLILPLLSAMALSLLMIIPSVQASSFKYCDEQGGYPVTINRVDVFPYPVKVFKPAQITIPANTDRSISNGVVIIYLWFFNVVPIYREFHDLCTKTSPGCPIETDSFTISHVQYFPFYAPPGPYTIEMIILEESGLLLSCFDFYITAAWPTVARTADS